MIEGKMKCFKTDLIKNLKQLCLLVCFIVFCAHCFNFQPPKIVEYQYQKSSAQEENQEEKKKPIVFTQRSILTVAEGDKCAEKKENHPCYGQCKKMYYWHNSKVRKCQNSLTVPQINILEETFDILWEPDFENLQKIHPDNFKEYLKIYSSALNRIIRKYGSKELEHFTLWIIYNEEIIKIFQNTDSNFERLADLLYRVAPYTEEDIYEPFIESLGKEKLMSAVISSENETAMELFFDFINATNKACIREAVSKSCFNIYCSIGRGISKHDRLNWTEFKEFYFYLSEIIDNKINSRQGEGRDENPNGWIYKDRNSRAGFEDAEDIGDFVTDLCQGLGYLD